jgi:2'-5' RNA ligase
LAEGQPLSKECQKQMDNMSRAGNDIAKIDVVLLPPPDVWQWLVSLSQQINARNKKIEFVLDECHMPHITLLHSYVWMEDFQKIFKDIKEVVKTFAPITIAAQRISAKILYGIQWVSVDIERTKQLHELHNKLSDMMLNHESKEGAFRKESSHNQYIPHFTLGANVGKVPTTIEPTQFIADRLAICILGPFGTCAKIVKEWKLKK